MTVVLCGAVSAANYTVGSGSGYNYSTISSAISGASDGDTIKVDTGTYNENVGVTKKLNITATGKATVNSFTITSSGSGSIVQGFTINNPAGQGILINNANNCRIIRNNISGSLMAINMQGNNNTISGNILNGVATSTGYSETVFMWNSVNNTISNNTITSTSTLSGDSHGIWLDGGGSNNTISGNTITTTSTGSAAYGIEIYDINNNISGNVISATGGPGYETCGIDIGTTSTGNTIIGNSIISSKYGVCSQYSDNHVNLNRIISDYPVYLVNPGTLDALYNWYGSNADPSSKISSGTSIIINYNPWLVLTVAASPSTIYTVGSSKITADFIHDSNGGIHDPSSGHFPNGIPVNFATNLGTVSSSSSTVNGIAQSTLNSGSVGTATVSATADGYTNNTPVTVILDTVKPTASANIKSGLYNTNKAITLSMSEAGHIYYTTNGATPTTGSTLYTGPINITSTTLLKFIAVDLTGNPSSIYAEQYTIDKTAPKIIATNPTNGVTGVSRAISRTIVITFSEKIKLFNKTYWSQIYVKNSKGQKVSISKYISGNKLTIKMNSIKAAYMWYTVYIPAGSVSDYAGNRFAHYYTFRFKTGKY